ncbi:MAG: FHA domain-containing protein [Burkholderiaceae bacterium]
MDALDGVGAVPAVPAAPDVQALLEILDRDGQARQTHVVHRWPLRVGRSLANDVVLNDPHVAATHLSIAPLAQGLTLTVGDTHNGVLLGRRRLHGGESALLTAGAEPIELRAGRTRLRLRLPGHALAPELPLAPVVSPGRRAAPAALAALVLVAGLLFRTYLDTDPDALARAAGGMLLATIVGGAVWCGAWALLSKMFTHQARFGWHLRVFLFSSVALLAADALPSLLAFSLSWPVVSDFSFVGDVAIAAIALYFHLLAVEPGHRRVLKWVAVVCAGVGVTLTMWFNLQRSDRLGEELSMNHLFPPALRLARPVSPATFIDGLTPLKRVLDKKAKETDRSDDGDASDVE